MKLLVRPSHGGGAPGHIVLLFGLGLIGRSVDVALRRFGPMHVTPFSYDWTDAHARAGHRNAIEAALADHLAQGPCHIDTVWTGGRSGFGSDDADMAREYNLVAEILDLSQRLQGRMPEMAHRVHLLSSAGGLFEGVRHCRASTPPQPGRAYGRGKLAQERLVQALPDTIHRRIYRPSSVYGYVPGGRVGLITALINNGRLFRTTNIFGTPDTLRDYVYAADVGAFIAHDILAPPSRGASDGIFLLATGQAVSMHEIIHHVERHLNCALYLQFDPRPSNAQDITFMPSARPQRQWHPTSLSAGIAQMALKMNGC